MSPVAKPPADERRAFAQRLGNALEQSSKSRSDLANGLGVHYNTIGLWLRSESDCPVGWIPLIATALGVSAQDLVQDPATAQATARPVPRDTLAQKVVDTLEGPLSAPDLMALLAEAKARL